jgi:hypothetical protein
MEVTRVCYSDPNTPNSWQFSFLLTANRPTVAEIDKKLREFGNFSADQLNFDRHLAGSKE